jgi:hypothetical protein
MHPLLNRVLEPARTSPIDPYRWRRDNRRVGEKVVSGLRLAGGLVAAFLVMTMALGGLATLPAGAPAYGRYGVLVSSAGLCVASIIMLWTVERWAAYLAGFFCVPAFFKALGVVLFGPNPNSRVPSSLLSRAEAAEVLAACAMVIALTWRFVVGRPAATTFLDRLALTFFVLAALKQAVTQYWPPIALISGFAALVIAWCAYRWKMSGNGSASQRRRVSPD